MPQGWSQLPYGMRKKSCSEVIERCHQPGSRVQATRALHNIQRVANIELISPGPLDPFDDLHVILRARSFRPSLMAEHFKRTRSQLSLPEEFSDVHFGISPLRAAKLERRRNIQSDLPAGSSDSPASPDVGVGGDESDDELLLSPPKARPPKRQSLSQQPEFAPETDHERQYKRLKQDHNDGVYLQWG